MFFRHVRISFQRQWFKFCMLGILMILSSLIYTVMSASVSAIQTGAETFFEDYSQEDFSIEFTPYLTEAELPDALLGCNTSAIYLDEIYHEDLVCFNQIFTQRKETLLAYMTRVNLEERRYKDTLVSTLNEHHRIRVLNDGQTINLSKIEKGREPLLPNEIAITRNYAKAHDINLEDSIVILDKVYIIVGFVLFPDYNLPVLAHDFLFDSVYQTLGLMSQEGFSQLQATERRYISGIFLESVNLKELEKQIVERSDLTPEFILNISLTTNNLRSGAIYAEIEGGQAAGLMFSIIIAIIGIVIIGIMIQKMVERERGSIGILKALGLMRNEMLVPFLMMVSIFAFLFLSIGYGIGLMLAPSFRDLFLSFYLLPHENITVTLLDALIAIIVPLGVVIGIVIYQLNKLFGQTPLQLMYPKIKMNSLKLINKLKKFIKPFNMVTRLQIGLLYRQIVKVIIYCIGIYFAFYLIFLSLGMRNVFSMTLTNYYQSTSISSIAYCIDWDLCDSKDYDRVIETKIMIDEHFVNVIALDGSNSTHPLSDSKNNDLLPMLHQGIVITKSFQDLSNLKVGDLTTIKVARKTIEVKIVGIADLYLGAYVFMDRSSLGNLLYEDETYYNAIYADTLLSEEDYMTVVVIEDILKQVGYTQKIMQMMFNVILVTALVMGTVIVYVLTGLSIEEQAYEMSVLRVLGYPEDIIGKILLGGYFKLNVVIFIVVLPSMVFSFYFLRVIMIDMYNFFIPLKMTWIDILITAMLGWLIFMISSMHAKQKIHKHELQEALKIFQV